MPGTPLKQRLTKQWGDLGFQGEDPQTDFRGMGRHCIEGVANGTQKIVGLSKF